MPLPYVRRRKPRKRSKVHKQDNAGSDAYFQMLLKFHDNILSISKSIFTCLFVFAATPIAILAGTSIEKFKQHIFEIVSIAGEMLLYCLVLLLMYLLLVTFFDLKLRSKAYFVERLKYMNSLMGFLSLVLLVIASVRCLYIYASIMELM